MVRVFILGNPRSGTSLLRIMLNSHPLIASPPECGFLHWWYPKYENWTRKDSIDLIKINAFVDDVLSSKKMETWHLNKELLTSKILSEQPLDYSSLSELVYATWALMNSHKNPQVIVDKNNYYIHHLKDLVKIWPDARFIHLIRDGRDVACSYLAMESLKTDSPYKPKLPSNISDIAIEWLTNNENIFQFLNHLEEGTTHIIRYEELVTRTESMLNSICEFLEVPMSLEMLNYYNHNDEPRSTSDWKKKTFEEPDIRNIGKYKELLSSEQIIQFNEIALIALKEFGYHV